MITFIALATLMLVAAAALLAIPLLRRPRGVAAGTDRSAANLAIFRDQLAELEHERAEDSLTADDFTQAKSELQRRLLEEVRPDATVTAGGDARPARKTMLLIAVLLPALALGGYALLGNPRALDPLNTQPPERVSAQQIEAMVTKLAERLKQNPDDAKGWVMLGRSYKMMGRYAEAADAYGHAQALVGDDPGLLLDYAEMLAASGKGFGGKVTQLIEKALQLAPDDAQALVMAGAAANERHDYKAAVAYWEKVLPQIEPGSEDAEALAGAIAKARSAAGMAKKH